MRVLLILCLLIGSIFCAPVDKEYAGTSSMRQPFPSGNLVSAIGLISGSGSSLPSLTKPLSGNTGLPAPQDATSTNVAVGNVVGGYTSVGPLGGSYYGGYGGSPNAEYGFDSSASGGSNVGGYDSSASAGYGYDRSASGGSYAGGYDSSASAGYGFDSSASGGRYDSSASAGYGFDSSASGGNYASGYDSSASAGYGFDSSTSGGSYASGYDSSASLGYGFDSSASGGSYAGGSASAYVGDSGSSGFAYGYDTGDDLEPVFSDVSDLDPVYTFSSRSRYQRGSAVFAQTRYTPEEPVPQQMPVRRVVSKTSKQSSLKAPTKGAF